jgi:two-component system response regulator AlgR
VAARPGSHDGVESAVRVLIADDEALARQRLTRLLAESGEHEVVGHAANGTQALAQVQALLPDVVLMDIRMPGLDGLEAARHLAALPEPPAVVFCTADDDHAIQAFDVQAVGYLLKPVRRDRLAAALAQAARVNRAQLAALRAGERAPRALLAARSHRGLERVPVDAVRFCRAEQKYVVVRHTHGEILVEDSLRDLEREFGDRFLRIHRSTLVAVQFLARLERADSGAVQVWVRDCPAPLEVSRRHLAAVRRVVRGRG